MTVRENRPWRRLLSLMLCAAMLVSFLPVTARAEEEPVVSAQAETEAEYVSLPVTIRDFAADGMLFEFAQPGVVSNTYATYAELDFLADSLNSSFIWSSTNQGIRIRTYATHGTKVTSSGNLSDVNWWYCIICDSDGDIIKILPAGEGSKAEYPTYMTEGCYSFWVWVGDGTGSDILAVIARVVPAAGDEAARGAVRPVRRLRRVAGGVHIGTGVLRQQRTAAALEVQALDQGVGDGPPRRGGHGEDPLFAVGLDPIGADRQRAEVQQRRAVAGGFVRRGRGRALADGAAPDIRQAHGTFRQGDQPHGKAGGVADLVQAEAGG